MREKIRLFGHLVIHDLRLRYAGSIGGCLWAFAMPAMTLLIFRVVFAEGFRNPPVRQVPYFLWFAAAYIPWAFFSDALTQGCSALLQYSALVKKMNFPVHLLPAVKAAGSFAVHLVFMLILVFAAAGEESALRPDAIQLVYYETAGFCLALACCYLLGAVTVFFRDNLSLTGLLLQAGFWTTPIVWDLEELPLGPVRAVLEKNPFCYITEGCRDSLFGGPAFWKRPDRGLWFWGICAAVWMAAAAVFWRLRPYFADEL